MKKGSVRLESHGRRGYAFLEYLVLVIVVMVALTTFRKYIQSAMQGQYRKAGDSFGMLRQYNPGASIDCAYNDKYNQWYSQECFNHKIVVDRCKVSSNFPVCVNTVRISCALSLCNP